VCNGTRLGGPVGATPLKLANMYVLFKVALSRKLATHKLAEEEETNCMEQSLSWEAN